MSTFFCFVNACDFGLTILNIIHHIQIMDCDCGIIYGIFTKDKFFFNIPFHHKETLAHNHFVVERQRVKVSNIVDLIIWKQLLGM